MFIKNALATLGVAATIGQAAAGLAHRHAHPLMKKAVVHTDVVVVTDWITVFVTEGEEKTAVTPVPSATAPAAGGAFKETNVAAVSSVPVSTTLAQVVKPVDPTTQVVPTVVTSAPVASSSAPAATSGSGGTGVSSNKRGLAYNSASLLATFSSKCSWAYNWASFADGTIPSGVEYVPMLWGPGSDKTSIWVENANKAIANGATHLLSFNEPDNGGQANISPAVAAAGHQQWMNPFSGKAKIGAPAVSSQADPGYGLDYFRQFKEACAGACKYDFCPVHWYGPASAAQGFIDFVKDAITACDGKPVWVTEFAAESGDKEAFMRTVIPQLDALAGVERYSYFMLSVGSLMDSTTSVSTLGNVYLSI